MQAQPQPQTRTRHSSRPVNGDGHPASVLVMIPHLLLRGNSVHPPGPTSGRDRHCEKLLDDLRELPCTRPDPQMSIVEDVEL